MSLVIAKGAFVALLPLRRILDTLIQSSRSWNSPWSDLLSVQ